LCVKQFLNTVSFTHPLRISCRDVRSCHFLSLFLTPTSSPLSLAFFVCNIQYTQQSKEYVRGLLSCSILLLFFFLGWSSLLVIFRFCAPTTGSNAIRWLGGQPLRIPSPPSLTRKKEEGGTTTTTIMIPNQAKHFTSAANLVENKDYQEWKNDFNRTKLQLVCFRVLVWIAGVAITISALVMSVYGVDSLSNTVEASQKSMSLVRNLAGDATAIVDSILAQNNMLSSQVFGMLDTINGMCPLVKDPLCDDVYNISTCDISAFAGADMNEMLQLAGAHFTDGDQSVIIQGITAAKHGLEDLQAMVVEVDDTYLTNVNWILSLSMVCSLLLAGLCLFILLGLVCPTIPKVLPFLQGKYMVPLFVVFVLFAYLFSMLFITASIVTADVCVATSPTDNIDERIMAVLERTGSNSLSELLGPIVVDTIDFYIHQCPLEKLPSVISEQLEYVEAGIPLIGQFSTIVKDTSTQKLIQGVCGFETNQSDNLLEVIDVIQTQLCSVANILNKIRTFLQCSNWYPLYSQTVYETLCYDGTKGFAYVATTQFIIVFCSFVILTFRIAFWDIQVGDQYYNFLTEDDDDDNDNERKKKKKNTGGGGGDDDDNDGHDKTGSYYQGIRNRVVAASSSTASARRVSSAANNTTSGSIPPATCRSSVLKAHPRRCVRGRVGPGPVSVDNSNNNNADDDDDEEQQQQHHQQHMLSPSSTAMTSPSSTDSYSLYNNNNSSSFSSFDNDDTFAAATAAATTTAAVAIRNSRYPSRRQNSDRNYHHHRHREEDKNHPIIRRRPPQLQLPTRTTAAAAATTTLSSFPATTATTTATNDEEDNNQHPTMTIQRPRPRPRPQLQTRITATGGGNDADGENYCRNNEDGDGIEVEHYYTYNDHDTDTTTSSSSSGNAMAADVPTRQTTTSIPTPTSVATPTPTPSDAWSVWARQQQDNNNANDDGKRSDDDDDDDDYSDGDSDDDSDDNYWKGEF